VSARDSLRPGSRLLIMPSVSRTGLAMVVIATIALACYANSLFGGFVSDDHLLIFDHPYTQKVSDWPRIFTVGHYAGSGGYRPLTTLSFALNYFAGNARPFGYHLVNVALHALNSVLIFLLFRRLMRSIGPAFAGGLLFAVHPIHTEAVDWISGRAELLATAFFIGAWILFLRSTQDNGFQRRPLAGSLLAFFAALLCKENALILPLVLILTNVLLGSNFPNDESNALVSFARWWSLLLYAAVAGLYFIFRWSLYHTALLRDTAQIKSIDNPLAHAAFLPRILTALKVQGEYLFLLIWPNKLSADYSFNSVPLVNHWDNAGLLVTLIVGVLLAAAATLSFFRGRRFWFGATFYVVAMLPTANLIVPIGTIKAERLLYLPSLGFCFVFGIAAVLAYRAISRWMTRERTAASLATGLLVLIIGTAAARTWERASVWRSEESFWKETARSEPNNLKAQLSWGDLALKAGRWPEAIEAFRRAHDIDPASEDALINWGVALMQNGRTDEAIAVYRGALARDPDRAAFHLNLGLAYLSAGRIEPGLAELRHAAELDPKNAGVHFNLGLALSRVGDLTDAESEYRRSLDLRPSSAEVWNALGAILLKEGKWSDAKRAFETALALKPNYPEAVYNLRILGVER
jgi:tetratricopeptide (TPR) repeat protein